jgi:tRNA A-37 threonylcarbamoyl transferase component Bud32
MDSARPVPHGFSLIKMGRTELVIRDTYRERLMERGIHNPEPLLRQHEDKARFMEGRGRLLRLPIDETGSEMMVIRHYEHGGIFRALTKDLFLGGSRPFRELVITEMAREAGVPTMEVLAAIKRRMLWPFYRGDLISKEIPSSSDLITYFTRRGKSPDRGHPAEKRELIHQAGRLVRKMHEAGIYHFDLHLKNFVVELREVGPRCLHIIDFDRSTVTYPLTSNKWFANLLRLDRSAEKWRAKGLSITQADRLRFLRSYLEGDEERKSFVKRHLKGLLLRRRRYRVGWAIERLFYG